MTIDNQHLDELMRLHAKLKVPIQHSVSLICKVQGVSPTELAEQFGHNRSYLSQSLRGVFKPSPDFREGVTQKLGIDPWRYAQE